MCDPMSVLLGAVGGMAAKKALTPNSPAASAPDPAAEQAAAEAKAQQSANAKLAADQKRRREQASLLSRGASAVSAPTLGDNPQTPGATSPLSGGAPMTASSAAKRTQSLMSRGATASGLAAY